MYAKPTVRSVDATTAVSSCTPCPSRYDSGGDPLYVSVTPRYTQVGDQGFCYPGGVRLAVNVQIHGGRILDGVLDRQNIVEIREPI